MKIMMRKSLIMVLVIAFFVPVCIKGQTTARHAGVSLHENMINSFFAAVGPVSGKGKKKKTKYRWTIIDPRVDVEPGEASFTARVKVKAGAFQTVEKAHGKVDIEYLQESNRIRVKVREAKVKLYFKLFGQKIPIGTIDVAKYYKPAFEFAGPQPIQKEVDVELPDGSVKKIRIDTVNEDLVLEKDRVVVYSDLKFTPIN